jgi:hypothetical protein
MPHVIRSYPCCAGDGVGPATAAACPRCAQPGTVLCAVATPEEEATRFERTYGLKADGPHLAAVEVQLKPLRQPCVRCAGSGFVADLRGARACPGCEGDGGIWAAETRKITARHAAIRSRFPDAVLPHSWLTTQPPPRQMSPRRPKGMSVDGLWYDEVRDAFRRAEETCGRDSRVKGQGHGRRVSLRPQYSRAIAPATRKWDWVNVRGSGGRRRMFPLEVVEEAARLIGIPSQVFISSEH